MKKPSPREEMTSYDHMAKLPISWFPVWCFSLHDGRSVVFSKFHCMPFPLFTPMAVPLAQASWKFVHSVEGEKKLQSQKSLFLALEFHKPISWNKAQDLDQCVSYKSNSCPGLDKDYLGWEIRSSKNRCRELRHFCLLERGPVTCCSLAECLVWKIPWLQLEGWRTNRWVHRGSAFHGWETEATLHTQATNSLPAPHHKTNGMVLSTQEGWTGHESWRTRRDRRLWWDAAVTYRINGAWRQIRGKDASGVLVWMQFLPPTLPVPQCPARRPKFRPNHEGSRE